MKSLCKDLVNEHDDLDKIVRDLSDEDWLTVTPFGDWTIKDEIGHLAYFDDRARLAVTDQGGFNTHLEDMIKGFTNFEDHIEKTLQKPRYMTPAELMKWWRDERNILMKAVEILDPKDRLPWYGPPMSVRSFVTARLMETWAHGQDVADTLGIKREPTNRLKHIAHLGVKTYGWSFKNRQMEVPDEIVRVELEGPTGEIWEWGEFGSENMIAGLAEDFCLVVSQRRNVKDTGLTVTGDAATKWMKFAQIFAGPPEKGPEAL